MVANTKLTNLQLELLGTFAYSVPDEQLLEIRQLLASYFLEKADAEMDRLWEENGWTQHAIESWVKGHDRTHYEPKS